MDTARRRTPRSFTLDEHAATRSNTAPLRDDIAPLATAASTGNGLGMEMARRSKLRLFNPEVLAVNRERSAPLMDDAAPVPTDTTPLPAAANKGTGLRNKTAARSSSIPSLTLAAPIATKNSTAP